MKLENTRKIGSMEIWKKKMRKYRENWNFGKYEIGKYSENWKHGNLEKENEKISRKLELWKI